jgi:hypothetical protein
VDPAVTGKGSSKGVFGGTAAQEKTQDAGILQSGAKYSQKGFDRMMRLVFTFFEPIPYLRLIVFSRKR